ncbi:MAG: hypothetical protein KKD77_20315, partial [Gammaproteobacteria bacterium]|nr:hypothetical protein [Gammaproteobacteria bacterium]
MVEKNPIYEQLNQLGAQISSLRQKLGATPNQWEKDALQKQIDALTEQRSMMLKYEAALPRDTEQVESKPGVAMFGTGGGAADIKEAQKEAGYERNLQAKWSGIIPVTGRNQLQNAAEQIIQNWTQGTLPNAASAIEGFVQQGGTLEMLEKGGVDVNAKPHEWVQSMKGNTMSIADAFNNDASYKNTAEYKTRQSMAGLAGTAGTPTVSQSGAPTYKFASSPELADIEKKIQGVLVKTPELTPDMVTKWQEKLNLAEAPFEQQAIERLRGEYNIASPYSYGSGTQMAATRKMITEQEANKAAKALSLGQQEYEAQRSDYDKALQRSIELETYKDQAS